MAVGSLTTVSVGTEPGGGLPAGGVVVVVVVGAVVEVVLVVDVVEVVVEDVVEVVDVVDEVDVQLFLHVVLPPFPLPAAAVPVKLATATAATAAVARARLRARVRCTVVLPRVPGAAREARWLRPHRSVAGRPVLGYGFAPPPSDGFAFLAVPLGHRH